MCTCQKKNINYLGKPSQATIDKYADFRNSRTPIKLTPSQIDSITGGDIVHGIIVAKDDPRIAPSKVPLAPAPVMQHKVITPEELQEINTIVSEQKAYAETQPGKRKYIDTTIPAEAKNTPISFLSNGLTTMGSWAIAAVVFGGMVLLTNNKKKKKPVKVIL
ncbi:hypothetical protein [Maribacter sp.]|uniref:hypothetical protein n=1 Tax=Maribacter sp. TaxID=1897614 RepID=UPI0025C2DA43|nr:hypothetical protein [Maribacter sp.]